MNIPSHIVQALGWALVHFLWQGAALCAVFALANLMLRKSGPNVRYVAGCATMLAMLAAPVSTFVVTYRGLLPPTRTAAVQASTAFTYVEAPSTPTALASSEAGPPPVIMPTLVLIWSTGVLFLSVWSLGGWAIAQRRKRRGEPLARAWQDRVDVLAGRLGIRRTVALCRSALLETPVVIGWIKPVILLPISALTSLTTEQIEMIIAHELAHIRRHDYIVNLVQTAVETLLFYHPAVWWVGRKIRAEREHCCDDLAVACCGDAVEYARALAQLEEVRCSAPAFAMAATGGPLLSRVRRLISRPHSAQESRSGWMIVAGVVVASVALCVARSTAAPATGRLDVGQATWSTVVQDVEPPPPPAAPAPIARPVHSHATLSTAPFPPATPDFPAPVVASVPAAPATAAGPPDPAGAPRSPNFPAAPSVPMALRTAPPPPVAPIALAQNGGGFLAGLVSSGYTKLSVDDIIMLKQNGISPEFMKGMREAGLGVPTPRQIVDLHNQGVSPEYAKACRNSGISDLAWERLPRLRNSGVDPAAMQAIHALGFGPFTTDDAIKLREHGVTSTFMQNLKNLGLTKVTIEQILKLRSAGL